MLSHISGRDVSPAKAPRPPLRHLGRETVPGVPHFVFPCSPSPLLAPFLKIALGALRQEHLPSLFEFCAGVVECRRRSVVLFAGIEAAGPFPRVGVARGVGARGDGAGLDIAIIDVPANQGAWDFDGGLARAWRYSSAGRGVRQWPDGMEGYGGPAQPSPTIAQSLNGGLHTRLSQLDMFGNERPLFRRAK
jgi:hypothetical protein